MSRQLKSIRKYMTSLCVDFGRMIGKGKGLKTTFSVPFNGDINALSVLYEHGANRFYGCASPPEGLINVGRARINVDNVSWDTVVEAVRLANDLDVPFEYVLNDPYVEGVENSVAKRESIVSFLHMIEQIGVTAVKVSSPAVAHLVHEHTSLEICVSKFARVYSPQQAQQWAKLGASCICLDLGILRDIEVLKAIRDNTNCQLELLVNDLCLAGCPYALAHANFSCLSSQVCQKEQYNHFYSFHCIQAFVKNPANLIEASFIRPEDIQRYIQLGFDRFKLTDRERPSSWVLNVLQSYRAGFYKGNLGDLFSLLSAWEKPEYSLSDIKRWNKYLTINNTHVINEFRRALPSLLGFRIDNERLNEFMEHFLKHSCSRMACSKCRYCEDVARRCVTMEGLHRFEAISLLDRTVDMLHQSAPSQLPISIR